MGFYKGREFALGDGFLEENWKRIIPNAVSLEEARARPLEIFPNCGRFWAYFV